MTTATTDTTASTPDAPERAEPQRAPATVTTSTPAARIRARWAGMTGKLGLAFVAAGFLVILLAWNGAAGIDYAQGQLPYLLSGGATGIGLIIIGSAFLVVESARRDRALVERRLEDLIGVLSRGAGAPATNGSAGPRAASAAVAADDGLVVAGRMSFHTTSCQLAEERDDADLVSRESAQARGLTPCRVCQP